MADKFDDWMSKHKVISRFGWFCLIIHLFVLLYYHYALESILTTCNATAILGINVTNSSGELVSNIDLMPVQNFPLIFITSTVTTFLYGRLSRGD